MINTVVVDKHESLEVLWGSPLQRASEKGYPAFYDDMEFWVLIDTSKDNQAIAYTGSLVIGDCVFVGNTYVRKEWRSKGLHKHLLRERNQSLLPIPKIAILNPLENIKMTRLESVVTSLGYKKVKSFDDVKDCLHKWVYNDIAHHNIWRLDFDSGKSEEE
tara:strand:+ start:8939 stop:9418 length:480 start_codon:yes stop_codon:yes gene_type:complete